MVAAPAPTSSSGPHHAMYTGSKKFIGAVQDEWQLFSDRAEDYTVGAPIGYGASSIVYAATYQPRSSDPHAPCSSPEPCALKVLDLDALPPRSLALLQRETTLMSLSKHPNVLRVRGSWMDGHKLYIALRLMNKGSAADVMRWGWPGGMEEDVVRCILSQALQGLNYLHINGFIHRDIKAANLLIDDDGTVLLGDLGVAADLAEDTSQLRTSKLASVTVASSFSATQTHHSHSSSTGNDGRSTPKRVVLFDNTVPVVERPKIGKRKSFVGTPCWMAPELILGKQYDSSADIWSFAITALELTQGRPPRSRDTPQRVLLRTIQDDPPTLDRDGGTYKYSKEFKEIVDSCLAKDPTKRPTAQALLETRFFKAAKKKSYLVNAILKDIPPLAVRQERRILPQPRTMQSIDSWDFAVTLHSAGTVMQRRRASDEVGHASPPPEMDGVFEMEDDLAHVESNPKEDMQEEPLEFSPSSPSAASDSEASAPPCRPSESSTSSRVSTPPSSLPESVSVPAGKGVAGKSIPDHIPIRRDAGMRASLSMSSHVPLSTSSPSASSPMSSSPNQSGLWRRIKSNVRRSSSRNNLLDEQSGKTGDKREKNGVGSFLNGARKQVVSMTSSHTSQAVAFLQGKT